MWLSGYQDSCCEVVADDQDLADAAPSPDILIYEPDILVEAAEEAIAETTYDLAVIIDEEVTTAEAAALVSSFNMEVMTSSYGNEVSWEITNGEEVVCSGGPYTAQTLY